MNFSKKVEGIFIENGIYVEVDFHVEVEKVEKDHFKVFILHLEEKVHLKGIYVV